MIDSIEALWQIKALISLGCLILVLDPGRSKLNFLLFLTLAAHWVAVMVLQDLLGTNSPFMARMATSVFAMISVCNIVRYTRTFWPLWISVLLIVSASNDLFFGYIDLVAPLGSNRLHQDIGAGLDYMNWLCLILHLLISLWMSHIKKRDFYEKRGWAYI